MKKLFTLFSVVFIGLGAMAEEVTYDFFSSLPQGWTASKAPASFETTNLSRGAQFTASTTLTLSGVKGVSKVVINCSTNIADKNTLAVSVGGQTWGTETLPKQNDMEKTFSGTAADGNLVITITRAEKSIYIKSVTVTASEAGNQGGGQGGDQGGSGSLNPDYNYSEPTLVTVQGDQGSNTTYSFIHNNILVNTTAGARTADYFGCNAGAQITFTATKPIKGLAINGFVKKDFTATADHGDLQYADATEAEVTADPVLILTDINSTSVTLTCAKQLRCYEVAIYFNENPDSEIENPGGGDDEDLSYEYEPNQVTTLSQTFDYADYTDYTEFLGFAITDVYFENDEYTLELYAFTPGVEGTGIAPGTYTIDDSYEEGTIQASPGGNDEEDYPSYLGYFPYDSASGENIYECTYYLVSGTLKVEADPLGVKFTLDAKSYNGSSIRASYTGEIINYGQESDGITAPALSSHGESTPAKRLNGAQIVIRHKNKNYNINGTLCSQE